MSDGNAPLLLSDRRHPLSVVAEDTLRQNAHVMNILHSYYTAFTPEEEGHPHEDVENLLFIS